MKASPPVWRHVADIAREHDVNPQRMREIFRRAGFTVIKLGRGSYQIKALDYNLWKARAVMMSPEEEAAFHTSIKNDCKRRRVI